MSSASAEIRIVYTALATLLRAPRNPKQHDLAALRTSMTRWGFTQPCRTVRLLTWGKFSIPVTPEEGAALEAAIAAWQETNGSLYGFITSILG